MASFKEKVVLITGATSGIGRASAEAFALSGASLVLTGRNAVAGRELVAALHLLGAKAHFIAGDVTREADISSWTATAQREFGRLDIAINNAGTEGSPAPIDKETAENFQRTFDTNVKGLLLSMKHEIPLLAKQGGAIVNVSSIVGQVGMAGASAYVASKHAVNGLTRSAALETARLGIRVNAIAPGGVVTPMLDRFTGGNRDFQAGFANLHPMGRLARPEEIARTILFLASDESKFTTGGVFLVDGGYTAQ